MISISVTLGYSYVIGTKIKNYYKSRTPSRFYGIQTLLGSFGIYGIHCFIELNHNIYYGITISQDSKRITYTNELDGLATTIGSLNTEMVDNGKKWFLGGNLKPAQPINFVEIKSLYQIANYDDRARWIEQTTNEIVSFIENVKSLGGIDVQSATHTPHNSA